MAIDNHPPDSSVGRIPLRIQAAVYGSALFSNTMPNMVWVALPLWVLTLDVSPFLIGVALGSRHVGPVLFAIHGGALMDRLGTRRVMLVFAFIGAAVPLRASASPSMSWRHNMAIPVAQATRALCRNTACSRDWRPM